MVRISRKNERGEETTNAKFARTSSAEIFAPEFLRRQKDGSALSDYGEPEP
jgi:hypothetical protein